VIVWRDFVVKLKAQSDVVLDDAWICGVFFNH
jgi:hypothetical protein